MMKLLTSPDRCLAQALKRYAQFISANLSLAVLTHIYCVHTQTASGISIVVMAAALYPEAQAAVARELDTVVGLDRCKSYVGCHS